MKVAISLLALGALLMLVMLVAIVYTVTYDASSAANVLLGGLLIYVVPALVLWGLGIWRIVWLRRKKSSAN